MVSSSLISAPSSWRSHVLHDMRLIAKPPLPARFPPEREAYSAVLFCTPVGPSFSTEAKCRLALPTPGQPAKYLLKQIIDNLYTSSPITTLPDCSLLSVDGRRRPLSCLFRFRISVAGCLSLLPLAYSSLNARSHSSLLLPYSRVSRLRCNLPLKASLPFSAAGNHLWQPAITTLLNKSHCSQHDPAPIRY